MGGGFRWIDDWFPAARAHLPGLASQVPLALLLVGCIAWLHVLGLVDDRRPLGPWIKLVAMAVPAFVIAMVHPNASSETRLLTSPFASTVVLGIISSKIATLENIDDLCKRIDEAAKYMPLQNMCVSPQCGFSSTHHGNAMTQDDQWRKMELVVNTAIKVWGKS